MTFSEIIEIYCSAWRDMPIEERCDLLRPFWTDASAYTDPTVHLTGLNALAEHIEKVQRKYPGSTIIQTTELDIHHNIGRFYWCKALSDGKRLPEGLDIVTFSHDGMIDQIVGFFGPLDRVR